MAVILPTETNKLVLSGFSWPAVAVLAGLGAFVVLFTYQGLRRGGRLRWALPLVALRLLALFGVALAILEPQALTQRVELLRKRVVILHDGSLSMGLPSGVPGVTRQEILHTALGGEGDLIDRMGRDFKVHCMEFGDAVAESSPQTLARKGAGVMPATDIRLALQAARERWGGDELEAVLLFSDGSDTENSFSPESANPILEEAKALNVPVFTFCPADANAFKDVAITGLRCSRIAFAREPWEAQVEVSVSGYPEGTLTVLLRSGENIAGMQRLPIQAGRKAYSARFSFTPTRTGKTPLSVEVQPQPGEEYLQNNYAGFVLSVIRDKIRVLQIAGHPSWDVRFLRRALEQIPNVDLVSFFILRDPADDTGQPTADSYVNLIPFPTEELFSRELSTFDVIIFQNFDYYLLYPLMGDFGSYLSNITSAVVENGAGFAMIGGEQAFDLGHYAGTRLEQILPVGLRGNRQVDERSFRAQLTLLGRRHPVTRIEADEARNAELWAQMPELSGCHVLPGLQAGAALLLSHPTLKSGAQQLPIVAVMDAGRGRTMAIATDETWKWGFQSAGKGETGKLYQHFWHNALRWLIHELDEDRLTVNLEQSRYEPGQKVRGFLLALDASYAPMPGVTIELRVSSTGPGAKQLSSETLTADSSGKASFELSPAGPGLYKLEASVLGGDPKPQTEMPPATAFVSVEAAGKELREAEPNEKLLHEIALASRGQSYNLARDRLPENLPVKPRRAERVLSRDSQPLWNNWFTYALVVGALCLEWWLRRKRGVS